MTGARLYSEHRFPDLSAATGALAGEIRTDLQEAVAARGAASLVVSGGKTPVALFEQLAGEALSWNAIWVTLADERWTPVDAPDSNENLVRRHLLQSHAAAARFVPLKNPAPTPEAGVDWSWRALKRIPRPYDIVALGMGEEGHFASLFPGSLGIARALDKSAAPTCLAMHSLTAPHARISQNLSALLDARRIVLLIAGEAKWATYQRAKQAGPSGELPIRALLQQKQTPVDVFWSL